MLLQSLTYTLLHGNCLGLSNGDSVALARASDTNDILVEADEMFYIVAREFGSGMANAGVFLIVSEDNDLREELCCLHAYETFNRASSSDSSSSRTMRACTRVECTNEAQLWKARLTAIEYALQV